ncbi:MAG TPA: hypothetical protein VMV31_08885 [Terriglobales bacterium]|nr:hypothetical protein [Terriglobales bacterium]
MTWLGLGLLLAGLILGVYPLLPAVPAPGVAMLGVPHMPWAAAGIAALGIILLLWQRARGEAEKP